MNFGKRTAIACALLCASAPAKLWASTDSPSPTKTSFAYSISHPVKPLPDSVIERLSDRLFESLDTDESDTIEVNGRPLDVGGAAIRPVNVRLGPPRPFSRDTVCSAVTSVAQANDLPVPFFANLIWQESSFNSATISRAGAQGIAQFMPRTAVEYGLINPFEPIHALNVAGKFVHELHRQFGNLGLAAAAYNAGPRRVADWLAKRGELPTETRNYVIRITGRPAETWAAVANKPDPETLLMPAKAPCVQVAEAVRAQARTVRLARLINELAEVANQVRAVPEQDSEAAAKAAESNTEEGWRLRATRMVRDMLKRMDDRMARRRAIAKAPTRTEVRASIRTAVKLAAREFDEDDLRAEGRNARKSELRVAEREPVKDDSKDADKSSDKQGTNEAAKAEPAKPAPRRQRSARSYAFDLHRPY